MTRSACFLLLAAIVCTCRWSIAADAPTSQPSIVFPKIDRHPASAANELFLMLRRMPMKPDAFPRFDPQSDNPFQMDLRNCNLSALDLANSANDLPYAHFDSRTVWPPADRLPRQFDPRRIMELGKDPGLGIRKLHAATTGQGVGIAIIDQVLLVEHQEYKDRLRLYEEINIKPNTVCQMHGSAVASIAVGKTVGVAPEADLYYIASWTGDFGDTGFAFNFRHHSQAVRRILQINAQLPPGRKIRVIAMATGWSPDQPGADELAAACDAAKAAGIFVICSNLEAMYGWRFNGLGRSPLADPDAFASYGPGLWWANRLPNPQFHTGRLLVPMDCRTAASPCGADEYVFYRQGGWSWSIPYIAGAYALAVQVDPAITPERFWEAAMRTGRSIEFKHGGETLKLGPILDPPSLIGAIKQ